VTAVARLVVHVATRPRRDALWQAHTVHTERVVKTCVGVLVAVAIFHVINVICSIRRAEEMVDRVPAPDRATIAQMLGDPDVSTDGETEYRGLRACRASAVDCSIAYWYASPWPWIYPTTWRFGFDRTGKGVETYRFASP
jgi:hypothetical protein